MKAPSVLILSQNGRIVINDLAVSLCPNLKKLKQEELLYVILAYDWINSPFRLRAPEERKRFAVARCWPERPDFLPEEDEKVKKGIEEFIGLIWNHNYDYRDRLTTKLIMLEQELVGETSGTRIKGLMDTMDVVSKKIDQLNEKILQRESELELRGGGTMTWIEQWQSNKEEFNKRAQVVL